VRRATGPFAAATVAAAVAVAVALAPVLAEGRPLALRQAQGERSLVASASPEARGERSPAERAVPRGDQAALQAIRLLAEEDVDGARAIAEPLLEKHPDDPAARLAVGVLRLFEQRYDEAISLMESARAGDPGGYLSLARAAREVTKGHVRVESEHFVVSHPRGKDEVLVPYLVDALERQRRALEAALGHAPEDRLVVEIVNDVRELASVTTLTEAEIRTTGTVAVAKFNKIMLLSPKALLKGYDWIDTAAHEYTHVVLTRKSRNRAPIWLQEGLAKWYEAAWRQGKQPLSPAEAAMVRHAVERDELVTFDEMHPSLAKLPSQERAALAYAEVVLAIERIVQLAGPRSPGRILDLVAEGKTADAAVAEVVGRPFDKFLADWKQHMATRPLPKGGDLALRRLRFKDDPKQGHAGAEWAEIADETARGFARLGEMMRARGRFTAARVEYGKAYERVGGKVPILSVQYALAAMMSGADDVAERVLVEAISWNPDYPALHVHLARILLRREEWARARDHLFTANRVDPFDPEIHAGLAKALAALGDPGGASREERFARILLPEAKR
jgi:tetratricopeptide (TPR) repeat protein